MPMIMNNLDGINNILNTFSNMQINNKTLIFSVIIVIGVLAYKFLDDRKHLKYYNDMKSEKNKEIERLADDNRRYRDIYLAQRGFSQEQIDEMSAANMKGG